MSDISVLNRRIHEQLRANMRGMPEHLRVGCFIAGFDTVIDNPYLNYAIPDDDAEPDEADIATLIAAFSERRRKPRLEYICEAAASVETALLRAGFTEEARLPIMMCSSADRVAEPATDVVVNFVSRDEDLQEAADAEARAFGDQNSHSGRLQHLLATGGLLAVARVPGVASIIGVGAAQPFHDGVTEIVGIGVLPEFRRRGAAAALAAAIARECLRRGASLVWLTADGAAAERIYARAGFVRESGMLHISKSHV